MMKRKILRLLLLCLVPVLGYVFYYAWISFPVITGFGAKSLCSCVFLAGEREADVRKNELGDFPLSMAGYTVNFNDSTVTAKVMGIARRKAIYRNGIGCTLVNGIPEDTIRAQHFALLTPPGKMDSVDWPMGNRISHAIPAEVDMDRLNSAVTAAFKEPHPDKQQRTRAVVVVYDGRLIVEKYAQGFTKESKMAGWSMAKSITAALIGVLVKQGKLTVDAPAPVPEWSDRGDPRHAVTLQHLLQQTSGLDFDEDYTGASEVTNMLSKEGDMGAFAARLPLRSAPGTVFNYSSGNSNILSRIIRQFVSAADYASFPARELFYKLGMYNTLLEPDASGTYVGSSYIFATARDYARFGLLYYNNGISNGEQILPEGWVKQTAQSPACNKSRNYGYQFWLNGIQRGTATQRIFPDAPADLFYADGYGYQDIYILPSAKLVVVRLGLTLDHSFDENGFLRDILQSFRRVAN